MMYRILVVDDEKQVRKGLISNFTKYSFSFDWIGEASNGKEALDIIAAESPHIVITDIRMPLVDGIELIRRAKERHSEIKFIIISGYAEFEYAEKALNMGVSGYILKPISRENLASALKKVTDSLEHELASKEIKIKKELLEEKNDSLIFERMVNQIFHSADQVWDEIDRRPEPRSENKYALVLIHIESENYSSSTFKYGDLEGIKISIREMLADIGMNENITILDNQKDISQLMVLVKSSQESTLRVICDHLALGAFSKIRKHLKLNVTIAISGIENCINSELYRQARSTFNLRLTYGSNQIYKYNSFEMNQKMDFPELKFKLLENCLGLYDFKNVKIILKDIFSVESMKKTPEVYIRFVYSEILNILLKICSKQDIEIEKSVDPEMLSGDILDRFNNVEDIVNYLYTSIIDIMKANAVVHLDCKDMIANIKNHISQNYAEDLMVRDMAQRFAVNPNYLSTIFKQETGVTITKYIEDIRIEKASRLLGGTKNSIPKIAASVGYRDTQYFFRVFKKVTGYTPMEYRNLIG